MTHKRTETDVAVIGGGPGGYAAAFRAAALGLDVALVSDEETLGGACLKRGCIPSKALLSLSDLIEETDHAADRGLHFRAPRIDLAGIREWKSGLVDTLTGGLDKLAGKKGVEVFNGRARFSDGNTLSVEGGDTATIAFRHAVIATGSRPNPLPGLEFREGGRIMDSAGALELADIPDKLLVVGGGYVGLELGTVYAALGSRVTLAEATDRLMGNADRDLVEPLEKRLQNIFQAIHYNTEVTEARETRKKVRVVLEGRKKARREFDRVLVAVSRSPNSEDLGLDDAGVETDDDGFIRVDHRRRTSTDHIYAIGDVAGGMLLAHEAMFEGKVAAEVIAGQPAAYDVRAVPAVVYTHPQVAWCGLTEKEAESAGREVEVVRFPWRASGRALTMGAGDGFTKLILDTRDGRVLGVGMVGAGAEGLIAEGVHALEMGATARDLALTMHPHPTLSETLGEAAELFLGAATHL
jgi:dihydrolipoamide dehydrogenase